MVEGLGRRKKVQGGHRALTQCIICQAYEIIESTDSIETVCSKLMQCLQEKPELVKQLDAEILELVEEGELEEEIGQVRRKEISYKAYKTLTRMGFTQVHPKYKKI